MKHVVMHLNPYFHFKGQCEAAFTFYERALGGKIVFMVTYEDTPMAGQIPAEWHKKICHATLMLGNTPVMGCDPPPNRFDAPAGFNITIGIKDPAEAKRIFDALSPNAEIVMPLQKTFWASSFGMLRDQYGIPWMINCGDGAP
jgi:PhnB protein